MNNISVGNYFSEIKNTVNDIDNEKIEQLANIIWDCVIQKRNIFFCGNGGSAANPSHSAGDWSKELGARTFCLSDNTAALTAWANDTDYSAVFSSQIKTYYNKGDILIAFSGSGNSSNVIKAVEYVNDNGGITIGLTGNYNNGQGGELAKLATHPIIFNTKSMEIIEDLQLIICHIIKELIKERISDTKK